jgi:hypothetical protein
VRRVDLNGLRVHGLRHTALNQTDGGAGDGNRTRVTSLEGSVEGDGCSCSDAA